MLDVVITWAPLFTFDLGAAELNLLTSEVDSLPSRSFERFVRVVPMGDLLWLPTIYERGSVSELVTLFLVAPWTSSVPR